MHLYKEEGAKKRDPLRFVWGPDVGNMFEYNAESLRLYLLAWRAGDGLLHSRDELHDILQGHMLYWVRMSGRAFACSVCGQYYSKQEGQCIQCRRR